MTTTPAARGGWSMVWGVLVLICGFLAISLPLASSIGIALVAGWLILTAGVWHLIFGFRGRSIGGVLWQLLLAVLYGAAGLLILFRPLAGVAWLTFVLATFLFIEACIEIALFFSIRQRTNGGWVLVDGIITLILAILIWAHWPSSSAWALGTLLGVSLIFSGISRLMLSSALAPRSP